MSGHTPSQTIGPFFHIALDNPGANRLVASAVSENTMVLSGRVFDGDGVAISDGLIEIWQADAAGVYHAQGSATFRCAGRVALDGEGNYRFVTCKPGRVAGTGVDQQAPHVNLTLFARGLLMHLRTRVYFADEATANASDPVLGLVPAARRATLIAERDGCGYRHDIHLQGWRETVFFDV